MNSIKVSIIGNSVGLRVRPPKEYPENKNYGLFLKELLQENYKNYNVLVNNLCIGRSTVWHTLQRRDEIIREFPDYYIVNVGVTDASTREIPLWFSELINSKKESLFRMILMGFYMFILVKFRPFLVSLRGKRPWISKKKYTKYLEKLISTLKKETNAKIIILSINKPTERIEKELPGSNENYLLYSDISKKIAEKHDAFYIDTTDLDPELYVPDGIHFSAEGNEIVAQKILDLFSV